MNKESSIKQLKRIKQDMTHADDVNALDFAIRYKKNKTLEKIRAEIDQITDTMGVSYNQYVSKIDVLQIIDKYKANKDGEE